MTPQVTIIRTGVANTASVVAAFERLGAEVRLTDDADDVRSAPLAVLPGVGAFGPAMQALRKRGLVEPLLERMRRDEPTLAVRLGLQLLCESSEESPGEMGLGVIRERIDRFGPKVRVPQFGWNSVAAGKSCRYLRDGYAYFANSYRLANTPDGWSTALSDYAGPFVAALERGRVLACQFHPELSARWGLALLDRWMSGGEAVC